MVVMVVDLAEVVVDHLVVILVIGDGIIIMVDIVEKVVEVVSTIPSLVRLGSLSMVGVDMQVLVMILLVQQLVQKQEEQHLAVQILLH